MAEEQDIDSVDIFVIRRITTAMFHVMRTSIGKTVMMGPELKELMILFRKDGLEKLPSTLITVLERNRKRDRRSSIFEGLMPMTRCVILQNYYLQSDYFFGRIWKNLPFHKAEDHRLIYHSGLSR